MAMNQFKEIKIIDLDEAHQQSYFVCLEDWSNEMKEAGNYKELWYERMKDKGLAVKLAQDENGRVGGMIQYIPIEHSFTTGEDLYVIKCIWVHGYQKGRGNFQGRGMGKALIQAAEADARSRGAKGMVAWGIPLPFWMKASWFKKQGYTRVDKMGLLGQVLLWKPFSDDAVPPRWIRMKKKPESIPGKVKVTSFLNGWCPAQNIVHERAKKASEEFGNLVEFEEIQTINRDVFLEWGISDALYINGKSVRTGPPPTFKKIKKIIARQVRKLRS
jgi:GNAT superfamily N-acetyltransferase